MIVRICELHLKYWAWKSLLTPNSLTNIWYKSDHINRHLHFNTSLVLNYNSCSIINYVPYSIVPVSIFFCPTSTTSITTYDITCSILFSMMLCYIDTMYFTLCARLAESCRWLIPLVLFTVHHSHMISQDSVQHTSGQHQLVIDFIYPIVHTHTHPLWYV